MKKIIHGIDEKDNKCYTIDNKTLKTMVVPYVFGLCYPIEGDCL